MNTDVRVLTHGNINALPRTLFRPISFDVALPEPRILLLLLTILLTLLGILYAKDLNRRMFISYQNLKIEQTTLQNFNRNLTLEKSALATPTRIQQIAQTNLNMMIPDTTQIVLVKPDDDKSMAFASTNTRLVARN